MPLSGYRVYPPPSVSPSCQITVNLEHGGDASRTPPLNNNRSERRLVFGPANRTIRSQRRHPVPASGYRFPGDSIRGDQGVSPPDEGVSSGSGSAIQS